MRVTAKGEDKDEVECADEANAESKVRARVCRVRLMLRVRVGRALSDSKQG